MGYIMIVAGLLILGVAFFTIRNGAVQKQIALFIPELAAGNGSTLSIDTFREKSEAVFALHNVTDIKKKRSMVLYGKIIAKKTITPEQNELIMDLIKNKRIF